MFIINQGFSLKSAQFNFERDYFEDLATLKAASEDWFPDNFITNVAGVLYQIKKSNSVDATTGKWRKYITVPNNATASADGYMSAADKKKLDGIAEGANKTIVDSAMSDSSTNPVQNKVVNTAMENLKTRVDGLQHELTNKASQADVDNQFESVNNDISDLQTGKADKTVATASANGLLSAADKAKLDAMASGATADSEITTAYIDSLFATA